MAQPLALGCTPCCNGKKDLGIGTFRPQKLFFHLELRSALKGFFSTSVATASVSNERAAVEDGEGEDVEVIKKSPSPARITTSASTAQELVGRSTIV